ncbi:MAG: C-GCAxxG-C-C family protein [Polyangia bacterium]|jgi:C_GCAxxG_C_C family probable redox protein|nr:C-GCAxxG-C-C family protein [Polyangia bacterium]
MSDPRIQLARSLLTEGFACSQAVFAAFAPGLGMDRDQALRVAQPLGGGMSHLGLTCGAVTGAFLVIGLAHGRTRADDDEAKSRTYQLCQAFAERFAAEHGSLGCTELLGHDLRVQDEATAAALAAAFEERCGRYVERAASLLVELLGPSPKIQ